jgi:hypothetical protein
VSAARGTGLHELSELIEAVLFPDIARQRLRIEMSAAGVRSQLFTRKLVRSESVRDDGTWLMDVDLASSQLAELLRRPGVTLEPPAARRKVRVKARAKSTAKKPAKRPSKVRSPCVPGSAFLQSARTRRRATG